MRHRWLQYLLFVVCAALIGLSWVAQSPVPVFSQSPTATKPSKQPTRQPRGPEGFPTSAYRPDTAAFNVILGRPTTNSVTLSLYAQADNQVAIAYVAYGSTAFVQTPPINLKANMPQNIDLTGLTPNTAYTYKLIINGQASDAHVFHTQRAIGDSFVFTLDADPHNRDPRFSGEVYARTLTNARADRPDFHINLGDTFMTEKVQSRTYAEAESTFTDMRPYLGIIGGDAPLFLVNGNHEGELGWLLRGTETGLPIWSTQLRERYYPNPMPGAFYTGSANSDASLNAIRDSYYAWTWGDALFVVLDPFWYTLTKPRPDNLDNNWGWTLGQAQYTWLKSTLAGSSARYKFIFIHHLVGGNDTDARGGIEAAPYFDWGGKNADGTYGFEKQRPGWGKPIHQLLVDYKVSAVFHGHDHVFVKQVLDGIIYQEMPQPSIAEYNNTRLAADYGYLNGDILGSSGHLRVTVTSAQVTVEYVRSYLPKDEKPNQKNGQVDNTYVITAKP